ncbi:MAG: zinc ABC transporter substrate-binding protein [Oscillatoriales cyanobacterium SM2_2_1]|nr:zinc ABC transporter substrate-binding protein [Oscillatoriales cyanobacterium SM2_2_1]
MFSARWPGDRQNEVDLQCLMAAGEDPHVYQASPRDAEAIAQAQLVLYNGYGYETSILKLIQNSQSQGAKVAVAEVAVPKPLMMDEHGHDHGHSHSEEKDGKPVADPHVWQDAANGIKMTNVVRDRLITVVPGQKTQFTANAQAYTTRLSALDRWIKAQTATIPPKNRKLVTTHEAFGYFAAAYGLEVEGALMGVSTENETSPGRLQELISDIRATGVPTIFAEATGNNKLMKAIAQDARVALASTPLFPEGAGAQGSGAETYLDSLRVNTTAIVTGLGGQLTPFPE